MSGLKYLLALILSMVISMPAPALALILTLKATATAHRTYVALDDVAEISDLSHPAMLDELRRFRVAAIPKPGQEIRLTRQLLTTSLRYEYPALSKTVQWRGADYVAVSIKSQSVDPDRLQTIAEGALRNALIRRLNQLELGLAVSIPKLTIPQGEVRITPLPINAETPSKRMSVALDISVGDYYRQTISVWFSVNAKIAVPISKTDIGIGTHLDDSLFETRIIDLGSTGSPIIVGSVSLSHMRTRLPLLAGQTLMQMDIEPAPTVSRQQAVTVQAHAKGITLQTNGIALNDGELGKLVRIRNSSSGKDFVALVVAPGVVRVEVK